MCVRQKQVCTCVICVASNDMLIRQKWKIHFSRNLSLLKKKKSAPSIPSTFAHNIHGLIR
jgi:hypothetical protein